METPRVLFSEMEQEASALALGQSSQVLLLAQALLYVCTCTIKSCMYSVLRTVSTENSLVHVVGEAPLYSMGLDLLIDLSERGWNVGTLHVLGQFRGLRGGQYGSTQ